MDVETFRSLLTPDGRRLLAEAVASYGDEDEFALGTRLRRSHPPALVAAALTQARLRLRARAKFDPDDAARMFFTADGLEQATRAGVSAHRAARFAGVDGPVADLCCGIGGDLIALARGRPAASDARITGVDVDPLTVAVARANVAGLGLEATVVRADVSTLDRTSFSAVMCDPSRRTAGRRVFDPGSYRPAWSFVERLLRESACVKVAPGIPYDRIPAGVEAEWISERGEVKEAALWAGRLASPDVRRRATLLPEAVTITDADAPDDPAVAPPGRWLIEPDGAVIRAGLVSAVASEVDGWLLDRRIAYVSTDNAPASRLGRSYEVVDQLPYDTKRLRAYVREHGIGALTIKKRGVGITPEVLRRELRPRGDHEATLVVTRVLGRATVLVVILRQ
ncbi:MAG TPA: class I SAM-dependent methyltransferase [Jiangellales bacterium]|nr:class I SAM-dependent methyltransferase [Jiangellales bacterium]